MFCLWSCDLITNIFGDLPQLRRHCWSVHLSRHPSQAAQPPVTWYMPWQSKQPAPNVGPGAYILSKSISWSFMSILMPIPLIKAIWMADFHGIWLLLPWRIQPRLIVMKQLSELMENLQDVHPYTTKRMHAFKSPRMKYIKTLHATSLLSVIFNAVNTPSFCGKPQSLGSLFQRFFFRQKHENRGRHCWDCCNPCCQWAPVWQLMWIIPSVWYPFTKMLQMLLFSSKSSWWNYSDYYIQCYFYNISQDSRIFPIISTPTASRTPYESVWCPPERSSKSAWNSKSRNIGFGVLEGPS